MALYKFIIIISINTANLRSTDLSKDFDKIDEKAHTS